MRAREKVSGREGMRGKGRGTNGAAGVIDPVRGKKTREGGDENDTASVCDGVLVSGFTLSLLGKFILLTVAARSPIS